MLKYFWRVLKLIYAQFFISTEIDAFLILFKNISGDFYVFVQFSILKYN